MALMQFLKLKSFSNLIDCGRRTIATTSLLRIKEIQEELKDGELTISAEIKQSDRVDHLLPAIKGAKKRLCPKCDLGLDIKHTDVLILSQYLRSDGCMLPRRVTGLCKVQQKNIGTMVTMAQKSGLMPNIAPSYSKRDPKKRYGWKKYNKYFDEKTITFRKRPINAD